MRERLVIAFVGLTLAVIGLYGIPRAYFLADLVRDHETATLESTATLLDALMTERTATDSAVQVEYCGEWFSIAPGDLFSIGREADLSIDDNPFLHRRLLEISERDVLGKALEISRLLKPMESSRIVTTLVGGDLAALASGPAMAMLTGVELLPLGLFSLGDLQACIEGGRNVHLVLPGAMEPALAQSRLASHPALASLVFVQRELSARALPAIDRPDIAIVDVAVRSAAEISLSRR